MLPDPFSVPMLASTPTTRGYTLINMGTNNTLRVRKTAAAGDTRVLKISHQVVGKGASARDRHLARFEAYVLEDGIENPAKPISLYLVADIPQVGTTDGQVTELYKMMTGLLLGGSGDVANSYDQAVFFDRLLAGEG